VHQWDGTFDPRMIGKNLAACSFEVARDGTVRDRHTGMAMTGSWTRETILGLCTLGAGAYPIARDDKVRAVAMGDWGRFLAGVIRAERGSCGRHYRGHHGHGCAGRRAQAADVRSEAPEA